MVSSHKIFPFLNNGDLFFLWPWAWPVQYFLVSGRTAWLFFGTVYLTYRFMVQLRWLLNIIKNTILKFINLFILVYCMAQILEIKKQNQVKFFLIFFSFLKKSNQTGITYFIRLEFVREGDSFRLASWFWVQENYQTRQTTLIMQIE